MFKERTMTRKTRGDKKFGARGERLERRDRDFDVPQSFRKRVCRLCSEKVKKIDYKDIKLLEKFITERGKIVTRRASRACARHQRKIAQALKRARFIALLPFVK